MKQTKHRSKPLAVAALAVVLSAHIAGAVSAAPATLPLQNHSGATPQYGWAKYYSPGLMARVGAKRGLPYNGGYLTEVPDCNRLGEYAYIRFARPGTTVYSPAERLLVVDCSTGADHARHVAQGLVTEAPYWIAQKYGFAGEGKTRAIVVKYSSR